MSDRRRGVMIVWVLGSLLALGTFAAVILTINEVHDPTRAPRANVPTGPVGPTELRNVDLQLVRRGYDPGQVDALLERAAMTMIAAGLDPATLDFDPAPVTDRATVTEPGTGFS